MKGYVTINTDASYHHEHRVGAFAFWIVSDHGRIIQSGPIKKINQTVRKHAAAEAEVKCILNAFYVLRNAKWPGITKIIVNTDCKNVISILTKNVTEINKWNLKWGGQLRQKFHEYKPNCLIEFRYVPAHKDTATAKAFVNQWCDDHAKKMLWETINAKV